MKTISRLQVSLVPSRLSIRALARSCAGIRTFNLLVAVLFGLWSGCTTTLQAAPRPRSRAPGATDSIQYEEGAHAAERIAQVRAAIHRSARYLRDSVTPSGRFVYLMNLNPGVKVPNRYNLLRHAGAIYALAAYQERWPSAGVADALTRAGSYLRRKIQPVPMRRDLMAVWEDEARAEAKLGGAGLALVALASRERVAPGSADLRELRRLGAFVSFMQKPEGGFYSKYLSEAGGRSDAFTSLYYPGEAALGLLMLDRLEPRGAWRDTAVRALSYLAKSRRGQTDVEADHWALIATGQLLQTAPEPQGGAVQVDQLLLEAHALQICQSILPTQELDPGSPLYGSFDPDGRTTPTATRLEGLTAAWPLIRSTASSDFQHRMRNAIEAGIDMLLRAQVERGHHAGAVPRQLSPDPSMSLPNAGEPGATEVRIDYVQHALSAWLGYLTMLEAAES